jgi:hydrogenase expression/formation protein HypE
MSEEKFITLAHGNGGRYMRELIEDIFVRHLANPLLDTRCDAAHIPLDAGEVLVTTDGFTVQPLEFPGGSIGSLAVHGTVNDLAVSGATPLYLCLSAFIEEGFAFEQLDRIVASLAQAAAECGVRVVAGDTKVVRRGEGGGVYLAVTGVGLRQPGVRLGMQYIRSGDALLVSGPVGDHGIAVMLAREQFGLRGNLPSDAASVLPHTQALLYSWPAKAGSWQSWRGRRPQPRWLHGASCRAENRPRSSDMQNWATDMWYWKPYLAGSGCWNSWKMSHCRGFVDDVPNG